MSNLSYSSGAAGVDDPDRYPTLGIIPKSNLGRLFFGWAIVNIVLALLPVFDILGNGAEPGPLAMPLTVFYCYAVFSLNCILGAVYYALRGRAWVDIEKSLEERATQ